MKTLTLNITGMSCGNCASHVQKALEKTRGVRSSRVDFAARKAFVEFDENLVGADRLIESIREEGYDAVLEVA